MKNELSHLLHPNYGMRLPENIRNAATLSNFKKNLKAHLFQECYKNRSYRTRANEQFIVIGATYINHYFYLKTNKGRGAYRMKFSVERNASSFEGGP